MCHEENDDARSRDCRHDALAGCNTVEGFGQDLKKGAGAVGHAIGKAGDKISETAQSMSGEPGAAEKKSAEPASGESAP